MAISFGTPSGNTSSTPGNQINQNFTTTSGADSKLICIASWQLSTGFTAASNPTASFNGDAMTRVALEQSADDTMVVAFFELFGPDVATGALTTNLGNATDTADSQGRGIVQAFDVHAGAGAAHFSEGSGTALADSLTTTWPNSAMVSYAAAFGGDTAPFSDGGGTTVWLQAGTGASATADHGVAWGVRTTQPTAVGSYGTAFTASVGDAWIMGSLEIRAADAVVPMPSPSALTLTGLAPGVLSPRTVAVPVAALTLTGLVPTIDATEDEAAAVGGGRIAPPLRGFLRGIIGA